MKKDQSPQVIALTELPESGFDFHYNRDCSDLGTHLDDLVGNSPYEASGHIHKLGDLYEISGEIKTQMPLGCCRCAADLEHPLHFKYRELLMITPTRQISEKESRVNHNSDLSGQQPFCNELQSAEFDLGEFLHEQIASNEPSRPLCGGDHCLNFAQIEKYFVSEKTDPLGPDNPFAALSQLKPNEKP